MPPKQGILSKLYVTRLASQDLKQFSASSDMDRDSALELRLRSICRKLNQLPAPSSTWAPHSCARAAPDH